MFEHVKSFPRAFVEVLRTFVEGIVYYVGRVVGFLSISYQKGRSDGIRKKVKG